MGKFGSLSAQGVLCCALFLQYFCLTSQFDMETLGKAAKGRLGSLYNLRNKLTRSSSSSSVVGSENSGHLQSSSIRRITPAQQKESRGYSFHLSSADISNPMFTQSYSTRDFHSRMGKVSDSSRKWKSSDKSLDKYAKYQYKIDNDNSWKDSNRSGLNSFNIHQLDAKNNSHESKAKVKQIVAVTTPQPTTTTTMSSIKPDKISPFLSNGLDLSPMKVLGQGLNTAMTTVLTQKLMGMIDQEVPSGFLNPLKHLVSSGQRMVEFWDKRANARDGKAPGIVEMFGYGIEQLKNYRDGQPMLSSDPIANITSASKTMIQGMMVIKKLTNRVLGYDTDDQAVVESRGGYGDHGGGYGWGHHVSYGHYLDPYAILATLGFGVFLFNVIFNLLNNAPAGGTSGRSFDVADIDIPLALSDIVSNGNTEQKIFGTPTVRTRRSADEDNPFFNSVVDKLEGVYRTYKTVSGNPSCAKLYMCRAAIQDSTDDHSLFSQLYTLGLGQLSGDMASVTMMKSIQTRVAKGEDVNCEAEIKGCSDSKFPKGDIKEMKFRRGQDDIGVLSALLVILLMALSTSGETGVENKSPGSETARYKLSQSTTSLLQRRDVPDVLLDPYSVLGVLSFGVYIFYILYSRYQMGVGGNQPHNPGGNTHHPSPGGGGGNQGNNPGVNMFSAGSQQNIAYLLDLASKIISNAANEGGNNTTLLDTLDYDVYVPSS
ncbi:unnamed protein product [Orchesella dallaii]|uniref:Uncharacterized protein n=1 Tax=Orchesella dallaii TaxID=48710 RepID=A0ABP1PUE5_9HEXA